MRHSILRSSTTGRRSAVLLATAALAVVPVATLAGPAQAQEAPKEAAVIGPLLTMAGFGTEIGVPLGCGLVTSAIDSAGQENSATEITSPITDAIAQGCEALNKNGNALVAEGKKQSAAFAAFNSVINPIIAAASDSVATFGGEQAEVIAPFGATVAGLGGTINFFQGSK